MISNRHPLVLLALLISTLVFAVAGTVQTLAAAKPAVFTGIVKGVAVGGYDPVAYFTTGKPTKGDPAVTLQHEGATWRFASAANRDAFAADPVRYAPRFGGYCAWAVANGYTAKGDPEAWTIADGKLYLNYNQSVKKDWEKDIPRNVAKGTANWPNVLTK